MIGENDESEEEDDEEEEDDIELVKDENDWKDDEEVETSSSPVRVNFFRRKVHPIRTKWSLTYWNISNKTVARGFSYYKHK